MGGLQRSAGHGAGTGSACQKGVWYTLPGIEGGDPEEEGQTHNVVGSTRSLTLPFAFSRTQVVLPFARALGSGLMY